MKKTQKTKAFSLQGFDAVHYKTTEQYVSAVDALFNRATAEIANLTANIAINPDKPFSFVDYPATMKHLQGIIDKLAHNMTAVVETGSRKQWLYACKKNDEFIASVINTTKLTKARLQKMQDRNLDAFQTFQKRKVNGMDLSQRVWKYVGQYKDQIELGLDVGLGEGRSAQQLSRDLRQNLQDPDRLFRRVKNKRGNLVLSKNAKAFHPGAGVYRSSAKNAMRLTRSEVNMAYRESDWLRWQQLEFVVGFEVHTSNKHEEFLKVWEKSHKGQTEICDKLKGKYPKTFKFKGWHPQCMCYCTPVLMDEETFDKQELSDLKSALYGTEYKKFTANNTVTDVPQGFKDWVAENEERQAGWSSTPYFVSDNFNNGQIAGGLKFANIAPPKHVKSDVEKADIQARWNTRVTGRKYSDLLQEIKAKYGNESDAIADLINRINTEIQSGTEISKVDALAGELNHKIQIKDAWDERREENRLGTLLVNVKALKSQFDMPTIQSVFNAIESKLTTWESLPLEQQIKKLNFEIEWVEKNKKYDTWKVAQAAYKKRLEMVEYLIDKQNIKASIAHALDFTQTTKSAKVKELAMVFNTLFDNNAPIAQLKQKALILNNEVAKLEAAKAARQSKKYAGKFDFDESNYTKARKDAAMWAKDSQEADKKVRGVIESIWKNAIIEEKEAAYYYTSGSSYVNEPLRGLTYSGYKGRDSKKDTENLTNMVNKSSYDFDIWVQRGVGYVNVQKIFGINLNNAGITEAKKFLLGKIGVEPAFASCANTKGSGFSSSEVIYNIYCPKGTKMLYCEPFSAYAGGNKGSKNGLNWDGKAQAKKIGYEAEMLLQRGTKFRVIKVEKTAYKWYIDLEVIGQ